MARWRELAGVELGCWGSTRCLQFGSAVLACNKSVHPTHLCDTQVFNGGDLVACACDVSEEAALLGRGGARLLSLLWPTTSCSEADSPRSSISYRCRGLMYCGQRWMSSAVSLPARRGPAGAVLVSISNYLKKII